MSAQPEPIRPVPFADALSERYLAYALSTITSRSLPDVRDGLKPVQPLTQRVGIEESA